MKHTEHQSFMVSLEDILTKPHPKLIENYPKSDKSEKLRNILYSKKYENISTLIGNTLFNNIISLINIIILIIIKIK
jgi:hypothetical protein